MSGAVVLVEHTFTGASYNILVEELLLLLQQNCSIKG